MRHRDDHRAEVQGERQHLEHLAAKKLGLNEIGYLQRVARPAMAFDPYRQKPRTGGFILIDRMTPTPRSAPA